MNPRDWRTENFRAKFQAAAVQLNATSHRDVQSLKFRGSTSLHDYQDLISDLAQMDIVEIRGDYQGRAWKITDAGGNSAIIVEHETGLEILYIVGAIASIVSLVPVVINTWNRMREHWPPYHGRFGRGGPERRRFDNKDRLIEEPAPPVEAIILQYILSQHDKLSERLSSLENEVTHLKSQVDGSSPKSVENKRAKVSDKKTKHDQVP